MKEVIKVKVFSDNLRYGNLAGVVLDATKLSEEEMQDIATEVGASETAFVFPSDRADYRIRWFTPANEVGICVHATIAAVAVLLAEGLTSRSIQIETKHVLLPVSLQTDRIFVNVPGFSIEKDIPQIANIEKYLGIKSQDLDSPPKIVKIFSDREVVLNLRNLQALADLRPSIDLYGQFCRASAVTGISFFCRETYGVDAQLHLREFAPLYGYLEDPLCGMACGCVLTYLRSQGEQLEDLSIEQGHFCDTKGLIEARFREDSGTWVGGSYCIVG